MTINWILMLNGAAVILSGLVAGVFLTFSDFVMRSLKAAQPVSGIDSMQMINREVYHSIFLPLMMGMVPISLLLAGIAALVPDNPASPWLLAGGSIYLIGVFLVTLVCNVPMNKRLDAMDLTAAQAYWTTYVKRWSGWNHIRTSASAASMICFFIASVKLAA